MKKLTVKTKRWAFKHAKEHVLEVLADVLDEEAHSVVTIDGEPPDGCAGRNTTPDQSNGAHNQACQSCELNFTLAQV